MPVATTGSGARKVYTEADAKAAVDIANQNYYNQMIRVRSDVTNDQFNSLTPQGTHGSAYRGTGIDVGHTSRHVVGTGTAGKSKFADDTTLHRAVAALLNSADGYAALLRLDNSNAGGDESAFSGKFINWETIEADIRGKNLIGTKQYGHGRFKIRSAICLIQKIGADTLWVYTAYPNRFVGGPLHS